MIRGILRCRCRVQAPHASLRATNHQLLFTRSLASKNGQPKVWESVKYSSSLPAPDFSTFLKDLRAEARAADCADHTSATLSKDVREFARKYNIGTQRDLARSFPKGQNAELQAKYGVMVSFTHRHVFYPGHIRWLIPPGSALVTMMLDKYAAKCAAEPLWLWFDAINAQAVVRRTATKRVKSAVWEVLKRAGYDRVGRPLAVEGKQRKSKVRLEGTTRIMVTNPQAMLKVPWEELVNHLAWLLQKMEPILSGRHVSARVPAQAPVRKVGGYLPRKVYK